MTTQITIIGTGLIGTSIGLALARYKDKVYRVGHDRDIQWANQAQKMGALDKVNFNLPSAVAGADIVLISVPMSEVRDTLTLIAPDLKEGNCLILIRNSSVGRFIVEKQKYTDIHISSSERLLHALAAAVVALIVISVLSTPFTAGSVAYFWYFVAYGGQSMPSSLQSVLLIAMATPFVCLSVAIFFFFRKTSQTIIKSYLHTSLLSGAIVVSMAVGAIVVYLLGI